MLPGVVTRTVAATDLGAISALHARVFGPGRFTRTAYRVREGTATVSSFCRVAVLGDRIIAAVRMTPVRIGGMSGALLLGPLAVDSDFANQGYARRIIGESLETARQAGVKIVILVGDEPYYGRLGFAPLPADRIRLPGPVNQARLLGLELVPGTLASFTGLVSADQKAPT